MESLLNRLLSGIARDEAVAAPFVVLAVSESAQIQRRAAQIWVRKKCSPDPLLPALVKRARHPRIRIGYFSADFRNHPAELFETHDRARFEVTAFSLGPDTNDEIRQRLQRAFDRFIDVRHLSDRDVALLSRSMELDIAIDLGGFTEDSRPSIFALRAAPIQISYLGYLGTMGAPYMDYLVADSTIVPAHARRFYGRKNHLPAELSGE